MAISRSPGCNCCGSSVNCNYVSMPFQKEAGDGTFNDDIWEVDGSSSSITSTPGSHITVTDDIIMPIVQRTGQDAFNVYLSALANNGGTSNRELIVRSASHEVKVNLLDYTLEIDTEGDAEWVPGNPFRTIDTSDTDTDSSNALVHVMAMFKKDWVGAEVACLSSDPAVAPTTGSSNVFIRSEYHGIGRTKSGAGITHDDGAFEIECVGPVALQSQYVDSSTGCKWYPQTYPCPPVFLHNTSHGNLGVGEWVNREIKDKFTNAGSVNLTIQSGSYSIPAARGGTTYWGRPSPVQGQSVTPLDGSVAYPGGGGGQSSWNEYTSAGLFRYELGMYSYLEWYPWHENSSVATPYPEPRTKFELGVLHSLCSSNRQDVDTDVAVNDTGAGGFTLVNTYTRFGCAEGGSNDTVVKWSP